MQELRSQIEIQATPERVWQILTDFASFKSWNPFIRRAIGKVQAGERLEVSIQPYGGHAMTFRPAVRIAEPGRELSWLGHLLVPGLFDGEHTFIIRPLTAASVLFIQREIFTGILVPLLMRGLASGTQLGFDEMNQALKTRAEQPGKTGDS